MKKDVLYMDKKSFDNLCEMCGDPGTVKGPQMSKKTVDLKNEMEHKKIKFKDLTDKYEFAPDHVREAVARMFNKEEKLILYCNLTMDSSHQGEATILITGPERTFKSDDPPRHLFDLPSMRQHYIGEIDLDDVVKELLIQGPR